MRLIKNIIQEKKKKKKMSSEENPCWDGYEMIGTKMKDGKEVPNCVPIQKENVKLYLSKDLLSEKKRKMKEFNDSIYALHIDYKNKKTKNNYKYEFDKKLYSNSKSIVDVLNTLNSFLEEHKIQFENINQKSDYRVEVITDNPDIEIILEKENFKWATFELAQVFARFE